MAEKAEVWEGWFTVCVVIVAFGCLLWDIIQPDHVMIGAVAVLMAAGVVTVEEGLDGFANEGLLTVAVLFVVVICLWCPWCSESNEPGIPPCKHGMCETDMSNNESASVWLGNGCCKSVAVWLVGR